MFGFFDSFKKGCGCVLGAATGLLIIGAIVVVVSMGPRCNVTF